MNPFQDTRPAVSVYIVADDSKRSNAAAIAHELTTWSSALATFDVQSAWHSDHDPDEPIIDPEFLGVATQQRLDVTDLLIALVDDSARVGFAVGYCHGRGIPVLFVAPTHQPLSSSFAATRHRRFDPATQDSLPHHALLAYEKGERSLAFVLRQTMRMDARPGDVERCWEMLRGIAAELGRVGGRPAAHLACGALAFARDDAGAR